MADERPTIDCHLLDREHLRKARVLTAGILCYTRANKRGRAKTGTPLAHALAKLTPLVYLWHFLAWKMGGFRRGVNLGTTADHKVVVIHDDRILLGDPMTEVVTHVVLDDDQDAEQLTAGLADLQAGRTRSLTEIDADVRRLAPPKDAQVVTPKSKFRYH